MTTPEVVAALAKLTLSLRVVGRRADGYHVLEAEMVTVDLADELRLSSGDDLEVLGDGVDVTSVPTGDDNLVRRALAAVGRRARVSLTKRIPVGGGLGGGSADAAGVLRWAGCDDPELAARLGSDVPFCLVGGRARVTGMGDNIEPMPMVDRQFTIVVPRLGCSTAAVYRAWDELGGPSGDGPNDLEPAALSVAPELARWRDRLGDATGQRPVLAGSGSSWFVEGAFPGDGRLVVRTATPPPVGSIG
ncbi:MAG: 4-(cytidine 5'-diphospho)-2-C-methyl-D-erythritol kinase [Acidimicrobiales bacterium]